MENDNGDEICTVSGIQLEQRGLMQKAKKSLNKKSGLLLKATREVLSARYLSEKNQDNYSLTGLKTIPLSVTELKGDGNPIIEVNGMYFVASDLDASDLAKDNDFKALVDSVIG